MQLFQFFCRFMFILAIVPSSLIFLLIGLAVMMNVSGSAMSGFRLMSRVLPVPIKILFSIVVLVSV